MAEDVAPVLLEKIKKSFEDGIEQNEAIKKLSKKLDNGGWGFLEAEHYALEVGKELSGAFLDNLSSDVLPNGRMYYNIANRVIPPMMREEYELSTDAALQVVANLNEKAGVRIAPQKPIIDEERVSGIVDKVSDAENFDDVKWMLGDPVQNFAVHCVDQTVEQNALFQHRAGLRPRIRRNSGGKCCDWCAALDGMYEYPGVPRDIFMRHENCNCTVEFLPGDGSAQNVYSKEWRDLDAIEERKAFSERALDSEEAYARVYKAEGIETAINRGKQWTGGSYPGPQKVISPEAYDELNKAALQNGVRLQNFETFDGDPELIKEFTDNVNQVLEYYGMSRADLPVILECSYRMSDDDFAITRGRTITVNGRAYRDREALFRSYAEQANKKYFVPETDANAIAYHEMGHVIFNSRFTSGNVQKSAKNLVVQLDLRGDVSEYANVRYEERIAEYFSAYFSNVEEKNLLQRAERCVNFFNSRR